VVKYVFFPFVWPVFGIVCIINGQALPLADWRGLYHLVSYASRHPINKDETYQDATLLQQAYQLSSALPYLQGAAMEWQQQEGYCAGATLRCILKSFSDFPTHLLPPPSYGPNDPESFCETVDNIWKDENGKNIKKKKTIAAQLFRLDNVSYEMFLQTLQTKLDDKNTRVAINYLRPALFGFSLPWYCWPMVPISFFFGLFAGHFSVILGVIHGNEEDSGGNNSAQQQQNHQPLIAVFDVNHIYGGTYFVPARRLYEAIEAKDISTRKSRALIFIQEQEA
jgi:hypothetical protein